MLTCIFAIWTAGQLIDTQTGFGIVSVIDPQTVYRCPDEQLKEYFALLVFFEWTSHPDRVDFGTYELVPLEGCSNR